MSSPIEKKFTEETDEIQNLNNLSTKSSNKKCLDRAYTIPGEEELDELNNIESLKELLFQISQENEEFKEKCNTMVNNAFEKEKIIQELLECINSKEEEHKKETQDLNDVIEKLTDKIHQHEIDLYKNDLKEEEDKLINKNKIKCDRARRSLYYKKFVQPTENKEEKIDNCEADTSEDSSEINELRHEVSQKEIEIQNLRISFEEKLKENEEKYQSYINDLQFEVNKFQETLNNKNEYGSHLKSQISLIDENLEVLESKNQSLMKEIQNLENLRKNEKFNFEKEKEKLEYEIVALKNILTEKSNLMKDFEEVNHKYNNSLKDLNQLRLTLANKEKAIEKLTNHAENLQKDIENKDFEKKTLQNEYTVLKNEFNNLGSMFKDNNSRLQEEFRNEKIKIAKLYENEKKEILNETEKMREKIIDLNKTIEKLKDYEGSNLKSKLPRISIPKVNLYKYQSNSIDFNNPLNEGSNELDDQQYLTLHDCLSINEENEENQELKNKIEEVSQKLEAKIKINEELNRKIEEINNKLENIILENCQLKSDLANERFERESENKNYKMQMKKLKEHIEKQESFMKSIKR